MLTKKEKTILAFLLEHQDAYVSSQAIADMIETSDRTARKYVQLVGEKIASHGAALLSKPGFGYQLLVTNQEAFQLYWQENQAKGKFVKEVTQLEEAGDRRYYIIHKLFLEGSNPTVLELAEELYMSKTSVSQLLREIRDVVSSYALEVVVKRKGIFVEGQEVAIRHFIKDYFFMDSFQASVFALINNDFLEKVHFSDIIMIVVDECRNAHLKLPDFILHNLVVHLALMISRIRLGYEVNSMVADSLSKKTQEYRVAKAILDSLSARFDLQFPDKEADYIAAHLHNGSRQVLEIPSNQEKLESCLLQALTDLGQRLGVSFLADSHLLASLKAHFQPLFNRLRNDIQLVNPLTQDILQQYPDVFEAVKTIFSQMPDLVNCTILDDEYAYISLHILASLEKMTSQLRYRVLVVCASGYGSARMLQNRLENEFANELEIVQVASYLDLTEQQLEGIDFIISSIDLTNLVFLVPIVQVSVLLNQGDIANIRSQMTKRVWSKSPKRVTQDKQPEADMTSLDMDTFFVAERFLYFEKKVGKEEVLHQMLARLEEAKDPDFQATFKKQMVMREQLSSVVYNEVLAFPHPIKALSQREQVVIGICKNPIVWDDKHRQVEFVFLLSPSIGQNEKMKYVTPALAHFVHQPSLQVLLKENPTLETLKKIILPLLKGKEERK